MLVPRVFKTTLKYLFASSSKHKTLSETSPSSTAKPKQVTQAYLQILSPKQTHDIIQKSFNSTSNLISELKQAISNNNNNSNKNIQLKQIHKQLQKQIKFLDPHHYKQIVILSSKSSHPLVKGLYRSVVNYFEKNINDSPLEDLINITYQMAKCNIRQNHLMKQLENRILDDGVPLQYHLIRKLLYTYTHLDIGTSTLYGTITRTIKLGYHELQPHHLAEFAYHLSKVSDNAKGGFGVFKITQEVTLRNIFRLKFDELITISQYMISQNIGSNEFQVTLQEQIYNKFPPTNQLNINHLKELLHSTSGYNFKFKDNALLQLLENQTLKNMKYTTIQQANIILWSWGRARRGNKQMWQQIQKYYLQKVQLLNARQLSFNYYSFSKSSHDCNKILNKMEEVFRKLDFSTINKHYLLKFLQGMHHRRAYNTELFKSVSEALIESLSKLTPKQYMNFIKILNQSDFDYESTDIDSLKTLLQSYEAKILAKLKQMKINDKIEVLFLWTKLNLPDNNNKFVKKLIDSIQDVNSIPKQSFLKALFTFIIKDEYSLGYKMIEILFELRNYGPIGYFFSPYEYPLLAYSVFTYYVKGRDRKGELLQMDKEQLEQIRTYFKQLQPRALNKFTQKVYKQTNQLINQYDTLVKQ